jgi:hypothetical protein
MGARSWQIEVAAPILIRALAQEEALELPESEENSAESSEEEKSSPTS